MIFKDYYKILELENNKVSKDEIKIAFREQAKKYHPDINNKTEERFKDINEAYKILSNDQAKRKYDRMWNNYVGKKMAKQEEPVNNETISSNFINMFFGGTNTQAKPKAEPKKSKKNMAIKGENIDTEITVGIEEAFYGMEKKFALRTVNRKNENIYHKNPIRN